MSYLTHNAAISRYPIRQFTNPLSTVSPDAIPSTVTLTYATPGDTNGIVYYLGTNKGVSSFSNPYPAIIGITGQNEAYDPSERATLTNRISDASGVSFTGDVTGIIVLTLPGVLSPTRYTIRNRNNPYNATQSVLSGSNDNVSFTTITTTSHTNQTNAGYNVSATISTASYYKYFKFALSGGGFSSLDDIELYGSYSI